MRSRIFLIGIGLMGAAGILGGCEARQGGVSFGRVALGPPAASRTAPARLSVTGGAALARRAQIAAMQAPAAEPTAAASSASFKTLSESQADRYLIKNAELTIEARDVRQAAVALVAAAQSVGGYASGSHETVDELGKRSSTVEARVPFRRIEEFLIQVGGLGKVLDRQISAEDVTEEFVDSEARLRNLKRTELRLLEHLNRTARLADVLLVEKELGRVRGEIDRLEGRLRFLGHRVAFSSATVTFQETPRSQALAPPEGYSSGKEASAAIRALVAFGRVLWTGAIWTGIWAAVWGPLALAGWLAYRRRRAAAAAG